jgi:hypothetical protein
LEKPLIRIPDTISVAFETNGVGHLAYLVELPGAFVRGKTEDEALAKVEREVTSYLKWLGLSKSYNVQVVQRHKSSLMVEDADNEILLDADKGKMKEDEFKQLIELTHYSGITFLMLYDKAQFKEWIDESRIRKTFYGQNPKTI